MDAMVDLPDESDERFAVYLERVGPSVQVHDGTREVSERRALLARTPAVPDSFDPPVAPTLHQHLKNEQRMSDLDVVGTDSDATSGGGAVNDLQRLNGFNGVDHLAPIPEVDLGDSLHSDTSPAQHEVIALDGTGEGVAQPMIDDADVDRHVVSVGSDQTHGPRLDVVVAAVAIEDGRGEPAELLRLDVAGAIDPAVKAPDTGHPPIQAAEATAESPTSLLHTISSVESLRVAWQVVHDNDLQDGELSRAGERFAKDLEARLVRLSTALRAATWRPGPLQEVVLPDDDGRELHIPSVEDRVVERSIASALVPLFDPWFSPRSFAYRPGLGVTDALRCVVEDRDSGLRWVVRADVADCFPTLDRKLLMERLRERIDDDAVLALVELLLARQERNRKGRLADIAEGIAQGAPLSPLFANIVLDQLDRALHRGGWSAARFADDIMVSVATRIEAERALDVLALYVGVLGQALAAEKSKIASVDEGIAYLGEDLGPRYPAFLEDARLREPDRKALYVQKDGALVRVEDGQFIVSLGEADLVKLPITVVGSITLFGNVGLSSGARSASFRSSTVVTFLSRRGQFQGTLQGADSASAPLRRAQYRASEDPEFAVALARRFVVGKVRNLRALLLRYGRGTACADSAERLAALAERLSAFDRVASLLGVEGTATAEYFSVFGSLLPHGVKFPGRVRRPPTDPVNAALSFGYTVLTGEAVGAVAAAGLDPSAGFLHLDQATRPSLALDLIEEFRPLVVDTVVLDLFRRRMLTERNFRKEGNAMLLNDDGREKFLHRFERRMLTTFHHTPTSRKVTYRRGLFLQARSIARTISTGRVLYEPIWWRD